MHDTMSRTLYSSEQKHLIEQLKKARAEAGFDQNEVARRLGRTQSYISKMESGQRRVDVIQLKKFARVYKRDISFFIA